MAVLILKFVKNAKKYLLQLLKMDIWIEGANWNQEQQDILAIKFGVWLSVNCEQDKSKDGWWLYEKKWLTTDECLLKFKDGNTTNTI
jgi:hypothetical protein